MLFKSPPPLLVLMSPLGSECIFRVSLSRTDYVLFPITQRRRLRVRGVECFSQGCLGPRGHQDPQRDVSEPKQQVSRHSLAGQKHPLVGGRPAL